MNKLTFFFLILPILCFGQKQEFPDHFTDKTLRIDYIFSGNATGSLAALKEMSQLPVWAGKRVNLSENLLKGNADICMYDLKTGESIYKDSFSSLFKEWLDIPEARSRTRSFEVTCLLPYPREEVRIEVRFRNRNGEYLPVITHPVDPNDILIRQKGNKNTTPYVELHTGGKTTECINIAIVAEGFTENEMDKFLEYARETCNQLFLHKPFDKYKHRFNIIAVKSNSLESGISIPRSGDWKNTPFGSHFDTFYSERYLTCPNVHAVHDVLAGIPYQHIIILANTDKYGGGGIFNAYTLTTTGHPDFKPVVVHEFGHSFAGLADEYFYDVPDETYPLSDEPWEPNITTLIDFDSKWKDLLPDHTPFPTALADSAQYPVGVYEGAGYKSRGIYRPAPNCRMKTNACNRFCPVCQRSIEKLILFYTENKFPEP